MKNILKNKLLCILIFFVCILASFFVTDSVFANDTNTFVFHNSIINEDVTVIKPSSLPEDYIYSMIILTETNIDYYSTSFIFSNNPISIFFDDEAGLTLKSSVGEGLNFYLCSIDSKYILTNGFSKTVYDFSKKFGYFHCYTSASSSSFHSYISKPNIISYANFDVYEYNTNNLLFQGAPVVEQITIPEIQSVEEIPQAMGEVLKILIPIGLIIFGIGLVIYLIRLVTSQVT